MVQAEVPSPHRIGYGAAAQVPDASLNRPIPSARDGVQFRYISAAQAAAVRGAVPVSTARFRRYSPMG